MAAAQGVAKYEKEMERYKEIQNEIQEVASLRQRYVQQANENGMVQQELNLLDSDAKVYKLIGPVLLKQDCDEAKTNVSKRLEFISNEMDKVNKKIELLEKEAVEIRVKVSGGAK